jgi:hypothetical protein
MALSLDGSNGITFPASNNVQNAAISAWVNFNGTSGASPVIRASYNIASVTRTAAGKYTINFTTAMTDANYAIVIGAGGDTSASNQGYGNIAPTATAGTQVQTASSCQVWGVNGANAQADITTFCVAIIR